SQAAHADLVKPDPQLILIYLNSEITIIVVVVLLEQQAAALNSRTGFQITHVGAIAGLLRRLPLAGLNQRVHIVAAISADHKWHIEIMAIESHSSRIALVIVRVTGNEGVGIDPFLLADGIDFAQHVRTTSVISARTSGARRRIIGERRMMDRN